MMRRKIYDGDKGEDVEQRREIKSGRMERKKMLRKLKERRKEKMYY